MKASDLERAQPGFADRLAESDRTVWKAAKFMRDKWGVPALVNPLRCRKPDDDPRDFRDDGDFYVQLRMEAKKRHGLDFKGPRDCCGFETLIVVDAEKHDQAFPQPWHYMLLNASETVWAHINVRATQSKWRRVTRTVDGIKRTNYECPVKLIDFYGSRDREPIE